MKIRTQFILNAVIFGLIFVTIAALFIVTSDREVRAAQQEAIARRLEKEADNLSYLSSAFLLYQEEQQASRWDSEIAAFSGNLASLKPSNLEHRGIIDDIAANLRGLQTVFSDARGILETAPTAGPVALDTTFTQVTWGRMQVQVRTMTIEAARLADALARQRDRLQLMNAILMFILLGVFGAFLATSYFLSYRRVLKSISDLQAGTNIIGSGDLDFRVEEKRADEVGQLSRAFNRMTASLKSVTASKAELEKEMAERKKTEEKLAYQVGLLSRVHDAVIATDANFRITYWNEVSEEMFGWTAEEALGREALELFQPRTIESSAQEGINKLLSEGRYEGEVEYLCKDGTHILGDARAAALRDPNGELLGIVTSVRDITERQKVLAALRESEEMFRTLADNSPDLISRFDMQLRHLYVNPAGLKTMGLPLDRVVGKTLEELKSPPDVAELWKNNMRKAIKTSSSIVMDYQTEGRDGPRCYQMVLAPEFDEDCLVTSLLSVTRDITELKRMERIKDEFIGMVSHELRTPLTVVIGALDVATKSGISGWDSRDLIRDALTQAYSLADIVENLLELSRFQVNKLAPRKEPTDIATTASAVVEKLRGKSAIHRLVVDLPAGLPQVFTDRIRVERVLYNLVDNAIKYSPGGGEVRISGKQERGDLVLSVGDEGIGIAPEDQPKLFQSFGRLNAYHTRMVSGVGLGLRVCQILVESLGGRIWFESQPGKGSTFCFSIPLTRG